MTHEDYPRGSNPQSAASGDTIVASRNLAMALDETELFLRRFVWFANPDQSVAVTLWVAHTWAFDHAGSTPYLAVTAPEKRTGKTRLIEVLTLIVHEPLSASSITSAALFRSIEQKHPTLLLDETDAVFGPKSAGNEDLRAVLNAGHRRGAKVLRMGGTKMTELQSFAVFCPKVLAGIGTLPDTITDRSIPIRLQRKTPAENVEKFRPSKEEETAATLRTMLEQAIALVDDYLSVHEPTLPDELNDRAQDGWEPLLAVADAAGGDWPARARTVAIALHNDEFVEEESLGIKLLTDINIVFADAKGPDKMATAELLNSLHHLEESPWGDYFGRQFTSRDLARMLRPYGVASWSIKVEKRTLRGYRWKDLQPAIARYAGPQVQPAQPANETQAETAEIQVQPDPQSCTQETAKTPTKHSEVAEVAPRRPGIDGEGGKEHEPVPVADVLSTVLPSIEEQAANLVEKELGGVPVDLHDTVATGRSTTPAA